MKESSNGLSIAGFIVSIGSLFVGLMGIVGLIGIALSAVGRSQAVRNGQKSGLATAGIILGIIGAGYNWYNLIALQSMIH